MAARVPARWRCPYCWCLPAFLIAAAPGCGTAPAAEDVDADGDGWSASEGDCDDGDAGIGPGAEEQPANGIDEDCDGLDVVVPSLADADVVIRGTSRAGKAGASVAAGGDVNGDGLGDLLFGAPGGEIPGCAYLFTGPVQSGDASDADAAFCGAEDPGAPGDATGGTAAFIGDGDGDGSEDLVVGASQYGDITGQGGAVFLFRGPISGELDTVDADSTFYGAAYGTAAGTSVAGVGDVDGDGLDDVAIGSVMLGQGDPAPGRVDLWFGPQADATGAADVSLTSDQNTDYAGLSIAAAGDVNGDGWVDLMIGAPLSGADLSRTGKVWLAYGPLTASGALGDSAASFAGAQDGDYAGQSVASAGDVDGDGGDDLLIGGHMAGAGGEQAGEAWLVLGPGPGTHSLGDADATFVGQSAHDRAGWAVTSGVVDGAPALVVAAIGYDPYEGANPGLLYVLAADATTFSAGAASVWKGEAAQDAAGTSITLAGDVTGDGAPDLVVGAPGNHAGGEGAGSVYVVAGGSILAR